MDITGTDVNTGAENRVSTVNNRFRSSVEGIPTVSRQLTAGAASTNTVLSVNATAISIFARTADIRYLIGSVAQTATLTSHFIPVNTRLNLALPPNANIAVLRDAATDGILEVTELLQIDVSNYQKRGRPCHT